ncbi:glycosyltransferase family 9 protein [Fluviispira sanaruensis]|uniref:Lipopolysaccharide heptosyltransferase family protein n=1 Tax=Fluviispira sanaruensis TaxID=2493639 RepID=A0A4P2VL47_FLUSA|nr:glycosyltransferase family 9 protein [Fluviispira sanaruensis]BBH52079.1 lipopolysaccharide heptosyltransferase family protein [Fluviispira sanaruensis]
MAKYLVLKLRAMGDTIILSSVIECIKKNDHNAIIDVYIMSEWKAVFLNNPNINHIYLYKNFKSRLISFLYAKIFIVLKFLFFIRLKKYDYAITCSASNTSSLYSLLSGAKNRANHFHSPRRKNKYSTVVIPDKGKHKSSIERDLDNLRGFGFKTDNAAETKIYISEDEKKWATNYVNSKLSAIDKPILILGIGAGRRTKIWPEKYFAKIAEDWIEKKNGIVLALLSRSEKNQVDELLKYLPKQCHSRFLQTSECSLRENFGILSIGTIFLGNDSGLKHAAIAIGLKTYTLFGPESPIEWHPYSKEQHPIFFIENLPCRTSTGRSCSIEKCEIENNKCLTQLYPEDVFKSITI